MIFKETDIKFREIFLKSPIGILFYDNEGKLIAANQSAKDIAGIPESEDVSVNLFNNLDVVSRKEKLIGEGVIKFQSQMNFEDMKAAGYYEPTRSGTAYLDFTISVVDSGYLVQIQDITKRKKIEERLMENEKKYRELVENSNSIILKMDKKGQITFFNEFAEKFFGFNKEKIMGKNVIGTIVPETESSGRNLRELINRIVSDPESHINMENENITHDKRRVWVAWTNKGIYNDDGEVTGVLSIGTDITKRKGAEDAFKHLMFEVSKSKNLILKELREAHNNLELKVQKRTRELNESNYALRKEIQERKHVEEDLIKSRNYLDKIINSIADPVFVKDNQHRWILLNDAYCKLMGYSREEILGKSDYDFFPSHEADIFWEKDEEVFKTGVENVNEEEFTDSEGNIHILLTKKTLYTDISGEQYIVASIRDITERKQAENELRQNERKLKLAMDMAKLAYWEYNVSSDLFTFDDRFYKLYGTTADHEGGLQMSSEEYAQKFLPPEESYMVREELTKALETDDPDFFGQVEHTIMMADGEKRFIIVRYGIIKDAEGRTIKTYGANQDITELKMAEKELRESELKYRTLFNSSPDSTILVGTDGNLMDVNLAAQEVAGLSKENLAGKHFTELNLLLDEEMPLHIKKVSQILEGKSLKPYESRFIDRSGKVRYVETYLKALKKDDEIFAFNVIAHDITERKKAEEKLKEIIDELERSNYELQQFAYITSHDLQEPLRTIASFTQLLERRYRGQLDSDADEFIEFIVDAAVRMKEMIQGLLEYSRVGTQKVEFKEVNMNVELGQALSNLHALITKNRAEITHDPLPDVMADSDQMVRVFQNLISNAIKFRKPGEPTKIHISCQIDKGNNEYMFSVADNGIGIEKEYKDKIFEVFKRLHAMGKYEGTGIGLSVVKRIIEQYDGRIWVESELGRGSTFYFTLPFTHSKDL
ncbi:PAS domain S-box protein [Methanobacterium sp.]|uniref:PAS domain-containing sensor histidine kinase n=1 Tax=Methanobacterium sp. TaxID=2164 RepID=UPI0031590C82